MPKQYDDKLKKKALELMNRLSPYSVSKQLSIPVRTLYDWRKKAQIVKEQISTEVVVNSTMKSLDILDEAIQLARKAGKVAETPLDLVRAAKALDDLGYKRADITGEIAQSKKIESDSQQKTSLSELMKDLFPRTQSQK